MDRGWFTIHAVPGERDEDFYMAEPAEHIDGNAEFRHRAYNAMGFVHEMDDGEEMFEFKIDRVLHTTWLDFHTLNLLQPVCR